MTRRLLPALGVLALLFSVTTGLATAAPAAHTPRDLADPPSNVQPRAQFLEACGGQQSTLNMSAQRRCDAAATKDFDRARAKEGMPPMTLPTDFPKLSPARQLLVIVNVERVDRGLAPAVGMSRTLNRLAQRGARDDSDPPFPRTQHGDAYGGNWAGGSDSVLLATYFWMYDDGPGSGNLDCQSPGDSGCWGHRHNIIEPYDAPLKIGAGIDKAKESIALELIGKDNVDRVMHPTWSRLSRDIPVGVHPSRVHGGSRGSTHRIRLWASGRSMSIRLHLRGAASSWSVSRSSCRLSPGQQCTAALTYHPTGGNTKATLLVTSPGGDRRVRLSG